MNSPLLKPLLFALAFAVTSFADFTPADSAKAAANCGGSFLSTTVLGKNPDNARAKAKTEIAQSIISNVKSQTKMTDQSEEIDGVLKESSKFSETSEIESNLTLLGFKEIETPKRQKNGEFELKSYICAKDAAKGFLEQQRLLSDSLSLAANTALSTKHPKHKNEAWQKTRRLWVEFIKLQKLLEVLGVESPYPAKEIYTRAKANYESYCRSVKVFWQDAGNECSKTVFSMLSNKIRMEKSKCSNGLKLDLNCPEKCASSSIEIECSVNPSLAIESCGGEKYSMLKIKEPITASHSQKKNLAMENLIENLPKAVFWSEWEKEIKEWIPKCVE
ncbi:MAG: hypothetical protein LBC64_08965 [Fibromonadaceae bacterium]|jgi:hypothetical protein|nr:hypothetical protein [Fibromonadaceae bacterium]